MQLRQLEVRNIRSYESGRVDFAPGTTLIVGDVGAGKTSLLYAIEMALFGVAEVDAAYLVRHGAPHAEVAVRFEDGEHRYDVRRRFRRLRRKGRESFESERIAFREDGRETSYSATEVRQRVIELLGFPDNPNPQAHSDLWRWAIYVPQERMREILSARPQDRLETIRRALGVERYRTAAENAQELGADLRASARHRRESADRLAHYDLEYAEAVETADRLRVERTELERAIASSATELEQARARLETVERDAHQREADLREVENLQRDQRSDAVATDQHYRLAGERRAEEGQRTAEREANRAEAAEADLRQRVVLAAEERAAEARTEFARHGDRIRLLATARSDLVAAERRREDATVRLSRATAERDVALQAVERATAEGPSREPPAPTSASLGEIDRRLADARSREHLLVERLAKARTELAEIDELLQGGICPRCRQPVKPEEFAAHRIEAAAAAHRVEAEQTTAAEAVASIDAERKSRERYERAHERWAELEKRRESLREALGRRQAEVDDANRTRDEAVQAAVAAQTRVAELARVEPETARLRGRLDDAENALRVAREASERSQRAVERVRAAEGALRALAAESERADRELAAAKHRVQERGERISSLLERTVGHADAAREVAAARDEATRAEQRLTEARSALVRADTRLDGEVRRVASAEKGRAERAALAAEAGELDRKAAWVSGPFRLHLLSMEQELLAHAQATFDRSFQRYFASLVDDPALVAQTDVGFTPEVMIDGEPTPAEALSGGERTALALAFRLALATVVRSLGEVRLECLLLDEPTDGFSAEQVIRMGELLGELSLPQVVIVSHEGQLASIADRTIRVRKVDGRAVLDTDLPDASDPLIAESPPRRSRATRLAESDAAPR
ncbi:MAG TPA: SMC family ATPase [Thermoplasmata archaeon]|nr:SMC family ATPase [Thermoplasmata archaeon]